MTAATAWSGRRVTAARVVVAGWLPAPCGQCGQIVAPGDRWVVGHKIPRWQRPDLAYDLANWQPEHKRCSDASAQREVIAKAKAAERARLAGFSRDAGAEQPPQLPISPSAANEGLINTRGDLAWSPEYLRRFDWLARFARVPADASPPLWMSPVPADAVGSYGAQAIRWINKQLGIKLRWWQRLAITRQLEHRADGSLCHREVVESAPRRAGKSVRIRGLALWRMEHGPKLFGERQSVVHTGSDVAVCRRLQKDSWRWARAYGWKVTVANGKEAIEDEGTGSEWVVKAQDAVYGYDGSLALVDEGWNVKPDTVSEGLEPTTLERASGQLHLTSTAHRRATSLMRVKITEALTVADPEVLVLIWAAPPSAPIGAPKTWRAASPHWTEQRRRFIARKYEAALNGEADPEADDPDPMAGFEAQYLNRWRLRERSGRGEAVVTETEWSALAVDDQLSATPNAAAIESWFADGVSLALAWKGDRVRVSVSDHPDLFAAAAALRDSGFRGQAVVGASLIDHPALKKTRKRKGEGRTTDTVQELARMLTEDAITHDGGSHLTGQVLAARTVASPDGRRMASSERADAIKAAVWAARRARLAQTGKTSLVLPSSAG